MDIESDEYGKGYAACAADQPITANPHTAGSTEWTEWAHGWQHYDADYNPDYYSHISRCYPELP